jgi:hypothetical protein
MTRAGPDLTRPGIRFFDFFGISNCIPKTLAGLWPALASLENFPNWNDLNSKSRKNQKSDSKADTAGSAI